MNQRKAFIETVDLAIDRGMPENPHLDTGLDHLMDMEDAISRHPEWSESKVGRWLGWAQCAVVCAGIATLEEVKQINLRNA